MTDPAAAPRLSRIGPRSSLRLARRSGSTPTWAGSDTENVLAARRDAKRLKRVIARSRVPMLLVDGDRRFIDANTPARLAFRLSMGELRRLRIDDLTPTHFLPLLKEAWVRLVETGCVAGPSEVASPAGTPLRVTYNAMANALPGLHLIAFAPADWPEDELVGEPEEHDLEGGLALTAREVEVLQLAADGHTVPMIAREFVVSPTTVRSHFRNIYGKLGVHDRAAAVASAMRSGLIV